jgi:hypothetical protein
VWGKRWAWCSLDDPSRATVSIAATPGRHRQRLGQKSGSGALPTVGIAAAMSYRFREALCAAKSLLHPGGLLQPTVMAQG